MFTMWCRKSHLMSHNIKFSELKCCFCPYTQPCLGGPSSSMKIHIIHEHKAELENRKGSPKNLEMESVHLRFAHKESQLDNALPFDGNEKLESDPLLGKSDPLDVESHDGNYFSGSNGFSVHDGAMTEPEHTFRHNSINRRSLRIMEKGISMDRLKHPKGTEPYNYRMQHSQKEIKDKDMFIYEEMTDCGEAKPKEKHNEKERHRRGELKNIFLELQRVTEGYYKSTGLDTSNKNTCTGIHTSKIQILNDAIKLIHSLQAQEEELQAEKEALLTHKSRLTAQYKDLKGHMCMAGVKNDVKTDGLVPQTARSSYQCPSCQKKYNSKRMLNRHQKDHNEVVCTMCGKKLKPRSLEDHMKMHSSEKKSQCQYCEQTFKYRSQLARHIEKTCSGK